MRQPHAALDALDPFLDQGEREAVMREAMAELPDGLLQVAGFRFPEADAVGLSLPAEAGRMVLVHRGGALDCGIVEHGLRVDGAGFRDRVLAGNWSEAAPLGTALCAIGIVGETHTDLVEAAESLAALARSGASLDALEPAEAACMAALRSGGAPPDLSAGLSGMLLGSVQKAMSDRATDDYVACMDELFGRLDLRALQVLRWSPRYGLDAYRWYAGDGPDARRRRLAAYRFCGFAGAVGDCPAAREALDSGGDPAAALRAALGAIVGRPFPRAVAARLLDLEFEPAPHVQRHAVAALAEIPPEWVPEAEIEIRAFMALAWGLRRSWSPDLPGSFRALVSSSKGRWWRFACAVVQDPPPETVHALEDQLESLQSYVGDMVRGFVLGVGLPLWHAAGPRDDAPDPEPRLRQAAWRLFVEGRGPIATYEAARAWHSGLREVLDAVHGEADSAARWPRLHEDVALPGGMALVSLDSASALRAEGRAGPDADGVEGLDHCVSVWAAGCAMGQSFVSSVRAADGRRLGTVEFRFVDGALRPIQASGLRNAPVDDAVVEAVEWFAAEVAAGRIATGEERMAAHVASLDGGRTARAVCGYDWSDPANCARALDAWRPYLAGAWREATPAAVLEALTASVTGVADPVDDPYGLLDPPEPFSLRRFLTVQRRRLGHWIAR